KLGALHLDVEVQAGDGTLILVGPNASGKSSVLLMLLGVLRPARGRIEVTNRVLFDSAAGVDVPVEARGLGYMPQHYALFPHLTVRGNIEFALASSPAFVQRRERSERARAMLAELELEALAERRATALSGGERQRVALARALSVRPSALLLDEPLAALDTSARHKVRLFLAAYLSELAVPSVVVTHDPNEARALGRQIAVIEAGRITQQGTWSELERHPASAFVEQFVRRESEPAP
ncbi:MAG TPA: ABC transporter ATP-binding protein, partial [Polyangiaceae bacterium]|nr:ABC transporter ATP-binding protein [Polyangiaceae bacterium]